MKPQAYDHCLPPGCRIYTLVDLAIHDGDLHSFVSIPNCQAALRFLELTSVGISVEWLQGLNDALPCLEKLTLKYCNRPDIADLEDASITPSRSLK